VTRVKRFELDVSIIKLYLASVILQVDRFSCFLQLDFLARDSAGGKAQHPPKTSQPPVKNSSIVSHSFEVIHKAESLCNFLWVWLVAEKNVVGATRS
jgi:hypothetical protein